MKKERRLAALLLLLSMVFALLPSFAPTARAYSETDTVYPVTGGNLYFDKTRGAITDCDKSVTEAVIPSEIDGIAVTEIGNFAFSGCKKLKSITIPVGVTELGCGVFQSCSGLQNVEIPDGVTENAKLNKEENNIKKKKLRLLAVSLLLLSMAVALLPTNGAGDT